MLVVRAVWVDVVRDGHPLTFDTQHRSGVGDARRLAEPVHHILSFAVQCLRLLLFAVKVAICCRRHVCAAQTRNMSTVRAHNILIEQGLRCGYLNELLNAVVTLVQIATVIRLFVIRQRQHPHTTVGFADGDLRQLMCARMCSLTLYRPRLFV